MHWTELLVKIGISKVTCTNAIHIHESTPAELIISYVQAQSQNQRYILENDNTLKSKHK